MYGVQNERPKAARALLPSRTTVRLPTLVQRRADIPILIDHFMKTFAKKHGKQIKGVSLPARRKLFAFGWPGNVRQLRNVVESMVVVDYDGLLDADDLPEELADPAEPAGSAPVTSLAGLVGKPLEEIDRLFIAETLRVTAGNREEAANMLGIGERTLYRKIKEYKL